jgi:polyisoprenoid-binding protein YceI
VRGRRWWIAGGTVAVVAVAALAAWWFLLRTDAPDPVSLEGAVASVTSSTVATTTSEAATTTTSPGNDETTTSTTASTPAPAGDGIEGSWVLAADGRSFAGYRVREELASIGAFTAAGRSTEVTGALEVAGSQATSVEVVVDMTALQSDDSRRDGAMRRQALETDAFPEASFRTTAPIELPAGAAGGEPVAVEATGDLTLHGVTREVSIPLEAQLVDGVVVVVGSLEIEFADYGIDTPSAAIVLSVEDRGVMEFQLAFVRP